MNELEIRKFIDVIHPNNQLFEIRVVDGKRTYSGYFTDSAKAYEAIQPYRNLNMYMVFNNIKEACYGRVQRDKIIQTPVTTSDVDIESRQWILIDIDPKRPSACNSTDEELKQALIVASKVGSFLKNIGFNEPIFAMSGNGYHMIYRINMQNTPENTNLIKDFLNVLSMYFGNEAVDIDTSVFNPARITKLVGTYSRKGSDMDELRPQRLSKILHIPSLIVKNDISLIKKVAEMLPKPVEATYQNNYGRDRFDIDRFIQENGIQIQKEININGTRKLILEECPFNSSHKAPDSAIFVMSNGAIGFRCLHNSCNHFTWKDLRLEFQPDAYKIYDNSRIIKPNKHNKDDIIPEKKAVGSKFLQLHEIENHDRSKIITIPTKIKELDKRIIGLNKGEASLVSGTSGSGKSTLMNEIGLNAVSAGFIVSIWSGELTAARMKHWIHLQAAGRQYTTKSTFSENSFFVKRNIGEKIDAWLTDKLFVYNNNYGNKFNQLLSDMREHVRKNKVDMIILDNLMALDILMLDGDKMQQQNEMIMSLTTFAKEENVHLILVAHPRKTVGFLRKNDIAGNADLANAVDNIFIIHRVNNDFVKTAAEFYGTAEASRYYSFSNVLECCKNRDLGVQDELFGLFFEVESKRFLNERFENIIYPWVEYLETKEIELTDYYKGSETYITQPNYSFDEDKTSDEYPF